jgi:hypothetical protein
MSFLNSNNVVKFQQEQYPGGPIVLNGLSFEIELVNKEKYIGQNVVTRYPVAKATDRADNLFRLPKEIILEGMLRDAYVNGVAVSPNVFDSIKDGLLGNSADSAKLSQAKTSLDLCFDAPTTYKVTTSVVKSLPSYAILRYELERQNKTSNVFLIKLHLQEMIISDSGSAPSTAPRKKPPP